MIVLVLGLHSTRYEGLRSRSGGGHENGGRSEQRVVGDSKGDGLMKRRRMTSAGGVFEEGYGGGGDGGGGEGGGHTLPFLAANNCHFCKKIWYLKSELYLQPTQATIV